MKISKILIFLVVFMTLIVSLTILNVPSMQWDDGPEPPPQVEIDSLLIIFFVFGLLIAFFKFLNPKTNKHD